MASQFYNVVLIKKTSPPPTCQASSLWNSLWTCPGPSGCSWRWWWHLLVQHACRSVPCFRRKQRASVLSGWHGLLPWLGPGLLFSSYCWDRFFFCRWRMVADQIFIHSDDAVHHHHWPSKNQWRQSSLTSKLARFFFFWFSLKSLGTHLAYFLTMPRSSCKMLFVVPNKTRGQ